MIPLLPVNFVKQCPINLMYVKWNGFQFYQIGPCLTTTSIAIIDSALCLAAFLLARTIFAQIIGNGDRKGRHIAFLQIEKDFCDSAQQTAFACSVDPHDEVDSTLPSQYRLMSKGDGNVLEWN